MSEIWVKFGARAVEMLHINLHLEILIPPLVKASAWRVICFLMASKAQACNFSNWYFHKQKLRLILEEFFCYTGIQDVNTLGKNCDSFSAGDFFLILDFTELQRISFLRDVCLPECG